MSGSKPVFDALNIVLEAELAFLQSLQLQLIEGGLLGQAMDDVVEVAVLASQLFQALTKLVGIGIVHGRRGGLVRFKRSARAIGACDREFDLW